MLKIITGLLAFFISFCAIAQQDSTLLKIKNNLVQLNSSYTPYSSELSFLTTYNGIINQHITGFNQSLDEEGKWSDINYQSKIRNAWEPVLHLYRVLNMTKDYAQNQSSERLEKIHQALAYWIKNDFICPNWWHNQINVPFVFSTILLNLKTDVQSQEMDYYLQKIVPRIKQNAATGQNKIWEQDCYARLALLRNDSQGFYTAMNTIKDFLVISTKEGIQPDYSFHQHGAMLQFGNYGLHFINSLVFWMNLTEGTKYDFGAEKKQILIDYYSKGIAKTIYKKKMDISAIGRQLRANAASVRAESLYSNYLLLKKIAKNNTNSLMLSGFGNHTDTLSTVNFWRSGYLIQQNPSQFFISVKTSGKYVARIESINAENAKGAYLSDGVTLFQNSAKEYENILPLWNWKTLPGTTTDTTINIHDAALLKSSNRSALVAQVSDGLAGISAMDYQRLSVKARKSYFLFQNTLLAMGNDIEGEDRKDLITSINQQLASSKSIKSGIYKGNKWVYFDYKLYFIVGKNQDLTYKIEKRTGSWDKIDAISDKGKIKGSVFDISLSHKKQNQYVYFVVAGIDAQEIHEKLAELSSYKIKNEKKRQVFETLDKLMVVFYEPDTLKFGEIKLMVDKPCLLVYDKIKDKASITSLSKIAETAQTAQTNVLNTNEIIQFFKSKIESFK